MPAAADVFVLSSVDILDSPEWSSEDEIDNQEFNRMFRRQQNERIRKEIKAERERKNALRAPVEEEEEKERRSQPSKEKVHKVSTNGNSGPARGHSDKMTRIEEKKALPVWSATESNEKTKRHHSRTNHFTGKKKGARTVAALNPLDLTVTTNAEPSLTTPLAKEAPPHNENIKTVKSILASSIKESRTEPLPKTDLRSPPSTKRPEGNHTNTDATPPMRRLRSIPDDWEDAARWASSVMKEDPHQRRLSVSSAPPDTSVNRLRPTELREAAVGEVGKEAPSAPLSRSSSHYDPSLGGSGSYPFLLGFPSVYPRRASSEDGNRSEGGPYYVEYDDYEVRPVDTKQRKGTDRRESEPENELYLLESAFIRKSYYTIAVATTADLDHTKSGQDLYSVFDRSEGDEEAIATIKPTVRRESLTSAKDRRHRPQLTTQRATARTVHPYKPSELYEDIGMGYSVLNMDSILKR